MLDPQSNSMFSKIYMLDEMKFANESIKALHFSNRTARRLHQAGVITIMDLLRMTPAMLMEINGFGTGCMEEVERELASLDEEQVVRGILTLRAIDNQEAELPSTIGEQCLWEKYGLNPADFTDVDISMLSFSARVSNVLKRNNISTVAGLLFRTTCNLRELRGFGQICEDEIENNLTLLQRKGRTIISSAEPSIVQKSTIQSKGAIFNAIPKEKRRLIASGDFSLLVGEELMDPDNEFVVRCIEAQQALGKELALACMDEPEKIIPILEMVREFGQMITWQQELQRALEELPAHRKDNQAVGYITTFTRHENEREHLLSLYPSPDAPLGAIANSNALDAMSVSLAKRFLTWCKYDLKEEIAHLFSILYPNERSRQIIQQRAQKKTLDQIGRKFSLTRERIRQIESKMQRAFNARQSRIKIISKINADKNNVALVTTANVAEYCTDNLQELLFLLRGCESSNFTYDKDLDVFIIGDDGIHERAFAFVEKLPELFNIKDIPKFYAEAAEEYDLPTELVDKAISEGYRLSGEVYYKSRLSLALIYTEIIREFYPDGIDAYDPTILVQFRQQVLDRYGAVKMPENDRALSARIAGICILCGRGRYRLKQNQYIPKELAQRICDYIEDSDMAIFMTNSLFAVFEDDLRKHGVDNKYYLQGILHELYGDRFFFTRDYVSKDPSITSIYPSIVNFIWCSNYPVTKKQIYDHFPGLPEIALNIATSDPEILVYFGGAFLHVDSLKISDDEKKYLNSVLSRVVKDRKIHHIKEVYEIANKEKPEIFTRNGALYPFSAGSILEYLFHNYYEFARPFIAKKGIDIAKPDERLREFVGRYTIVTVEQIAEFIRSSRINVPSLLDLIDECNDRFLLTDADTMQIIENTGINCEIAQKIEKMILEEITGTVRVMDLSCWGKLPIVKLPWTDWMVYSALKKWATKVEVAASYPQFRYAIPLVAPVGKMNTAPFSEAVKTGTNPSGSTGAIIHDLDRIDDLIADLIDIEEWED